MKGQLRIDIPGYSPEHAAGKPYKPYKPATYSQRVDKARISIKDQAREYALWLMKNGIEHCHVYPLKKSPLAASNEFRQYLRGFHRGPLELIEVEPDEFLGGAR